MSSDDAERFRVPPAPCPNCGKVLETAFIPGDHEALRPSRGDVTVCKFCDAVLCFTVHGGGGLRRMTSVEFAKLPRDEQLAIAKVRIVTRRIRENRRH